MPIGQLDQLGCSYCWDGLWKGMLQITCLSIQLKRHLWFERSSA